MPSQENLNTPIELIFREGDRTEIIDLGSRYIALAKEIRGLREAHQKKVVEHKEAVTKLRLDYDAKYQSLWDRHQRLRKKHEDLITHVDHCPHVRIVRPAPIASRSFVADIPEHIIVGHDNADKPCGRKDLSELKVPINAESCAMSNPTKDYDNSDEENMIQPIDYNASRDELLQALKASQLSVVKLLAENRKLRKDNSDLAAASSRKRRKGAQNDDILGYKSQILGLAKRFLFTRALFLDRKAFQSEPPERPINPRDQFTSDAAYTDSLTISLFNEVPEKSHPLLDAQTYAGFANDFIRDHGDSRSSFINTLRKALPSILKGLDVDSDLLTTASADRSKNSALASLLQYPTEKKPTLFAPVLFPGSTQNMSEIFTGPIFLKVHRLMYFGPGSLAANAKPAQNSNGIKLAFKEIRFVLSPDKEWAPKGAISGINWEAEYRAYLELLEFSRSQPHTKKIFKKIHKFVFAGVTSNSTDANTNDSDDETDNITDLMRRFELGTDSVSDLDEDVQLDPVDDTPVDDAPIDDTPPSAPFKKDQKTLCNIYILKHGLWLLPPCMALEGQVGEGQEAGSGINEKAGAFGQRRGARYTRAASGHAPCRMFWARQERHGDRPPGSGLVRGRRKQEAHDPVFHVHCPPLSCSALATAYLQYIYIAQDFLEPKKKVNM
ncbi:hypothetical protein DFH09DRAFT_1075545 [Mycena vulgaris]|nr:hypothetical protein DFH09DRAFT_1075545 [Mycena vulgaris]